MARSEQIPRSLESLTHLVEAHDRHAGKAFAVLQKGLALLGMNLSRKQRAARMSARASDSGAKRVPTIHVQDLT